MCFSLRGGIDHASVLNRRTQYAQERPGLLDGGIVGAIVDYVEWPIEPVAGFLSDG
jgi:hypothetical protein